MPNEPPRAPQALVTGASGFIGRHLVRGLLARGRKVMALARSPGCLDDLASPRLEVLPARIEEIARFEGRLGSDVTVFHLAAARNAPSRSIDRFRDVNVTACCALAETCRRARIAVFVNISSAVVFGPGPAPRSEEGGFPDGAPPGGYRWSRQEACRRLEDIAAAGLRLVTVYPTIVFGPDDRTHPNRITGHIRALLRNRIDWTIGGGMQRRNLVLVNDVVEGILLAESAGRSGRGYILGGEDWTPRDVNRVSLQEAGKEALLRVSVPLSLALTTARAADRIRGFPRAVGYEQAVDTLARHWCFSSRRAEDELGYRPTPVREAIRRTVDFLKAGENDGK